MNPVLTSNDFRLKLKAAPSGMFLFFGEEDFMKQWCLRELRKSISPDGDVFNITRLSAADPDFSLRTFADVCSALPVFADARMTELHETDFTSLSEARLNAFCDTLRAIAPDMQGESYRNVLVIYTSADEFDGGTVNRPSAILKKLGEIVTPVRFDYESPARLNAWIEKHFAAAQIISPPDARNALIARCGKSMVSLEKEIDKLIAYLGAHGENRLTEEAIREVTPEHTEINAFDFSNALLARDADAALTILADMKLRREKPELILGSVIRVVDDLCTVRCALDSGLGSREIASKLGMHEYKAGLYVKAASKLSAERLRGDVERCAAADLQIKASGLDSYTILDILVSDLCMRR